MAKPRKYITKQDILRAMQMTKSNMQAARYLDIGYHSYREKSKLYFDENGVSLFEKHKNQLGFGIKKFNTLKHKDEWLPKILAGEEFTLNYSPEEFKMKLIQQCILPEECKSCGFKEKRIIDYKVPVILNYKDGNKTNWKLENLEFLCYNCFYLQVGDIFNPNKTRLKDNFENKVEQDKVWEMDENMREHFESLGLLNDDEIPEGLEFRDYNEL